MQQTSATWKRLWAAGARLETLAVINGVEYTQMSNPIITRALTQNGLSIGNAASATCQFAIQTADAIPRAARVEIKMRLTDGSARSEWIPAGRFFIAKRQRDPVTGLLTLECYDALLKANALVKDLMYNLEPWTDEHGDPITTQTGQQILFTVLGQAHYPYTMEDMAIALGAAIGADIDPRTAFKTGSLYTVDQPDKDTTIRDVLSRIAAAHGANWIITPAGMLRMVPVDMAERDSVVVGGIVGGIDLGMTGQVTGIRYQSDDGTVVLGDETGIVIDTGLDAALSGVLADELTGISYRSFALTGAIYDPAAELGDAVTAGANGEISAVLYSETATLAGLYTANISAPDAGELADEYPYIGAASQSLQALRMDLRALENVAIQSVDVEFAQNQSAAVAPTSGWSTDAPAWREGYYIWQRTATTSDEGTSYSQPTCISGRDGADGTSVTILGAYDTLAELQAAHPTGSPGDGYMVGTDLYVWNDSTSAWQDVGRIQGPEGPQGAQGPQGATGATGIGVSEIVEQYYLSTSSTTQTGGSWSANQPEWASGKYIWTRSRVTWTNNTITYTAPVLAQAINGANSSASNAQSTANAASSAVTTLDDSLNQQGVFNRLTNNGQTQGIYLKDGKLYINATYIDTGTLVADIIKGGTLTLGGSNNTSGTLMVKDASNNTIGEWNNNGITVLKGALNISYIRQYYDDTYFFDQNGYILKRVVNKGLSSERTSTISISGEAIYINTQGNLNDEINIQSTYGGNLYEMGISPRNGIDWKAHGNRFIYVTPIPTGIGTGVILYTDFIVTSGNTKSKVVSTDQYSDRFLYCYETPSPMYGDVGEAIIGDDGLCYVTIDPIFAQTITTDNYQVFLQRYGAGDCYVQERKGGWFVVSGTPGLAFGWEIKGKQADIADVGLRRLDRNDEKFTVPTQTYGEDAAQHIIDIQKERIPA